MCIRKGVKISTSTQLCLLHSSMQYEANYDMFMVSSKCSSPTTLAYQINEHTRLLNSKSFFCCTLLTLFLAVHSSVLGGILTSNFSSLKNGSIRSKNMHSGHLEMFPSTKHLYSLLNHSKIFLIQRKKFLITKRKNKRTNHYFLIRSYFTI